MEIALRISGYTPWYLDARALVPSQNPEILYEPRPGFRGLFSGVPISINSQGFRGKELSNSQGTTPFRVVVAGDSIAFGAGVRDDETLSAHIGTRLQRKVRAPVEAVNLGVPGYNACQAYLRFKERALPLNPQVVVYEFYDDDTERFPPNVTVKGDLVVTPDVRTGLFGDLMASARKHSALYNLAWTRWNVWKGPRYSLERYREILTYRFSDSYEGWRRSRDCITNLISLTRAHSIRIIVIPFPVMEGFTQSPSLVAETAYPFEHYVRTVCNAVRSAGAECLDVVPLLQRSRVRYRVSLVEEHPPGEVFAKIAEQLVDMLP